MSKFPEIGTDEFAKTIAFELKGLVDKIEEQFGKESGSKIAITMLAMTGETSSSFFAFGSSYLIQMMFAQFVRHVADETKKKAEELRLFVATMLANIGYAAVHGFQRGEMVFDQSTQL